MVDFKHVYKTYDSDRHALRDISFTLKKSDIIVLTGPSGAGKTTLFKLLSVQEKISSGEFFFNQEDVSTFNIHKIAAYRRKIGIVFQDFRLNPQLNIFDNVAAPLKIQNYSGKEINIAVNRVLDRFGLQSYSQSYPNYISGGEKQRVAIARSIVHKPQLLIADEPTGNLDRQNANTMMSIFSELAREGVAVMIATHDEGLLIKNETSNHRRHIHLENGLIIKEAVL